MIGSEYWQERMDYFKKVRAEHPDNEVYSRYEILTRAEIEMALAIEAVEKKP